MADNFNFTPGTGGTGAADDVGGVLYPRVKLTLGADGAADIDVDSGQQTSANSVPVVIASDQSTVPVSTASLPLPTGAATSAKQDTIIGHIDGIEGLLSTIDTDTGVIAGAVSGTEMQVDVVSSALPTGAATEATLSSIKTATELIDDTVYTDGSGTVTKGVAILGQDGTNPQAIKTDSSGELQIDVLSSALPTGASTLAEQQSQTTHLATIAGDTTNIETAVQLIDDAVYTDGSGTPSKGIGVMGTDGTNPQLLKTDTSGELQVDVLTVPTVTVQATDLDVRNLVAASDAVSVHGDVGIIDQLDLTNSNPAVVAIVDSNGDQITSFGGGTQYTEDAASAADPVGTAPILVRADTPGAVTTTNGDNVAQRGTNYGAAYVQVVSSSGSFVDTFGGGTQYTEGDTDATISGTAMLWEDTSDTLRPVSSAKPLPVNVISGSAAGTEYTEGDADATIAGTAIMFESNTGTNTLSAVSNTTPLPVSDAGGSLTVDAASLPLPTGAATLAEQQSQTTHLATIAGDTTAIQTGVELIDDTITAQGTALGTTKTILNGASVTTAAPSYTTGQISPINQTTAGALRVDIGATSANATAVKVNVASGGIASGAIASGAIASGAIAAGAIAAGATSIATTEDTASAAGDHLVKVAQIRLDTPVSGANTSASGDYTQFIADSFGKTWTAGTYAEDLAHVAGEPIRGNGVRRIDTPASSAGTSGDWATMDASAEGALWTTNTPTTTGGCTIFRTLDLDETEEEVKATAGNVYGYFFYNAATSVRYLKFYNATAASVSVGTTTPVLTLPLPASSAGHITFPYAVGFSTAICVAATTGLADADTGAPSANDVILNVFYK